MIVKILFKIAIYIICILMIFGGLYMIKVWPSYDNSYLNSKQIISGIGIISVALVFIISDLLINIINRKKK